MAGPRATFVRRVVLWSCAAIGGACTGVGAVMLLQVHWIEYVREEVAQLGRLELWFGKVLFNWRPLDEKLALALSEIPADALERARSVSWGLMIAGTAVAVIGPWLLRWRWRA